MVSMLPADFLHQPETIVAVDDGQRAVSLWPAFVSVDCRAQLRKLVVDELAKLGQIFKLLRIVVHQILRALQDSGNCPSAIW